MDTSSYFIDGKCLFGCYPTYDGLIELEANGVVLFVDLTTEQEKVRLNVYQTEKRYISFPIKDRYIPINLHEYTKFIIQLCNEINHLKDGEKVYIHCKGGHGRSGIVVACILSYMNNISGEESILLTTKYHSNRKTMRDRWRCLGSPQTNKQKEFIIRMFKPIFLTNVNIHNTYYILNNNSLYNIKIDSYNYKNINRCYYSLKYPELKDRIKKCNSLHEFKKVLENITSSTSKFDSIEFFRKMLKKKIKCKRVIDVLVRTFLRPIVYVEDEIDLGKIWTELRNNYLLHIDNCTKQQ